MWVILISLFVFIQNSECQRRPPNYSIEQMPSTSFSCRHKILGGYYADPETDCQMFHVCVKIPGLGIQNFKFLCPNDTAFDQENQICDDWYNIDCEAATLYYSDNFDLYRLGSEIPKKPIKLTTINNAVSDIEDDLFLQKSDRGENIGTDLLRGSHSSNFYSNKNRGREDYENDEITKDEYNRKNKKVQSTNNNGKVRKLLTGKRPVQTVTTQTTGSSNNNYFKNNRNTNYYSTTPSSTTTQYYNNDQYNQRNDYYRRTNKQSFTSSSTSNGNNFNNQNTTPKPIFNNQNTTPKPFFNNQNRVTQKQNTVNSNYQTTQKPFFNQNYQQTTQKPYNSPSTYQTTYKPFNNNNNQNTFQTTINPYNNQHTYQTTQKNFNAQNTYQSNPVTYNSNTNFQSTQKPQNTFITSEKTYYNNQNYQTTTKVNYNNQNVYRTTQAPINYNYNQNSYSTTQQPSNSDATVSNANTNLYETQKLFRINVASHTPDYNEQEDEFLKTDFSQNLGVSRLNQLQNSYNKNLTVKSSFKFASENSAVTTRRPNYNRQPITTTTVIPSTTIATQHFSKNNNYYTTTRRSNNYSQSNNNYSSQQTNSPKIQRPSASTEIPRPFQSQQPTGTNKQPVNDYDYAYYDAGNANGDYDNFEHVEFSRTTPRKN